MLIVCLTFMVDRVRPANKPWLHTGAYQLGQLQLGYALQNLK